MIANDARVFDQGLELVWAQHGTAHGVELMEDTFMIRPFLAYDFPGKTCSENAMTERTQPTIVSDLAQLVLRLDRIQHGFQHGLAAEAFTGHAPKLNEGPHLERPHRASQGCQ